MHVGDLIRQIRTKKGLTLGEVAAAARVSPTTLGKLERTGADFTQTTLDAVATALGTDHLEMYGLLKIKDPHVRQGLIEKTALRRTAELKSDGGQADDPRAPGGETPTEQARRVMAKHVEDNAVIAAAVSVLALLPPQEQREWLDELMARALRGAPGRKQAGNE